MSFETLLTQIEGGNIQEALATAKGLETDFNSTTGNLATATTNLQAMEGRFNGSIGDRDKAKAKLTHLASTLGLGIEDMTDENVSKLIKNGKTDETLKAEITSLQTKITDINSGYEKKLDEANQKFTSKMIENEIAKVGLTSNVVNNRALETVIKSLKDNATINESGVIVYLDGNGATQLNSTGQPLGVADRMAAFQNDADNAYLFKATSSGGGGSSSSQSSGSKVMDRKDFDNLNPSQRAKFMSDGGKLN